MTEILKVEFFRLKKSKLFWIMFGVAALLPLLSVLLFTLLANVLTALPQETSVDGWSFIRSLNMTALLLSSFGSPSDDSALLAVICSGIFLSREFSYGTLGKMLIARRSRGEIYASYLLIALTVGASYMGVAMLSTLIFSGSVFGFGQMNAAQSVVSVVTAFAMGLVAVAFVQTMTCMFLFGTRSLAAAIALPIVICNIVPSVISGIVSFWETIVTVTTNNVPNANLSWIPLYNASLLDLSQIDGALIGKILLYFVPLSVFFGCMGWVFFRKADLK